VLHETNLFVTVKTLDIPWVPFAERARAEPLCKDAWSITLQFGFKNDVDVPAALELLQGHGFELDPMRTSYFLSRSTVIRPSASAIRTASGDTRSPRPSALSTASISLHRPRVCSSERSGSSSCRWQNILKHQRFQPAREFRVETGRGNRMVREAYAAAGLTSRVEPFLYEMDREMRAADVIVCRSGATTLAELTAAGRTAILIPLPTATDDHQRKNADALARQGAARVIDQRELTGARIADEVLALARDAGARGRMAAAARAMARPDAARVIVDKVLMLAGHGQPPARRAGN